jgi:predicted acyltransferase
MQQNNNRLQSIDALVGFDMLWIMGGLGIIAALYAIFGGKPLEWLHLQMEHASWDGFHFMDLIFPLFLFIAGLLFLFSLDKKREKQESNPQIIGDLVKRTLKLIALGLIYNGFLKFNFPEIRYASVLAHIGLVWFFTGLIYIYSQKLSTIVIWAVPILVGYGTLNLLVLSPEATGNNPFLPENNIVCQFDRWFLFYNGNFDSESFLSIILAIATAIAGMMTGRYLKRNATHTPNRKVLLYLVEGAALIVFALLVDTFIPINKALWSSSFVLLTGGISILLFAFFYWIINVLQWRGWTFFFRVIGLNSITIYMAQSIVNFYGISEYFLGGIASKLPKDFGWLLESVGCGYLLTVPLFFIPKKSISQSIKFVESLTIKILMLLNSLNSNKSMSKKHIFILLLCFITIVLQAQTIYTLDASRLKSTEIKTGYFKMGIGDNAKGETMSVNNRYLMINGRPEIPVMGELQYSRMDKSRWADEILKMKACGVNVIATYSFWNHHEEIEGQFNWSGNKDLRSFVKLCGELGVYAYPRIGPWSHGEARNGGTPDWILKKKYLVDRSADPVYKTYVDKYFAQIGKQLQGLLFKDGGPVIGIQLENEYWKGNAGEPYILWLKQTAQKYGMDVPLYTVTGWGDGSVPPGEVIPLWGGYPDESWVPNIEKITGRGNYTFSSFRDDETIGNVQVKKKDNYLDHSNLPYFTCEMGVGIFVSTHRRPIIGPIDGLGMMMTKIGSGGNLLGYYIFAGASQPLGVYSTMEENKDETGYWCELSPISYDFQAAIREDGSLNKSYYEVKRFNYFLREFGDLLAPAEPVFVAKAKDDFQYAARLKDDSGFFFGINYSRNNPTSEKNNVRFSVNLKQQTLTFPSTPVNVPDSSLFVWPINMDLNGINLQYATAQPLFSDKKGNWIFVQDLNVIPEFSFDSKNIASVKSSNGKVTDNGKTWLVTGLQPWKNCVISIEKRSGELQRIVVLSKEEGKYAWILDNENGEKQFFLSRSTLYMQHGQLKVMDTNNRMNISMFIPAKPELFSEYQFNQPKQEPVCSAQPKGALHDAKWLATSTAKITPDNLLNHRMFQKEFSAMNPAAIKWAKLVIAPESACRLRINENWCGQTIEPNKLNVIDITGFVKKGENVLLMDFPLEAGRKAFAARIIIEYFNSERYDFSTDESWLSAEQYYLPAVYGDKPVYPLGFQVPIIAETRKDFSSQTIPDFKEWTVHVPCNYRKGLNNLYLAMDYVGDRVSVRLNNHLIADNLNNNTTWMMNLSRLDNQVECADLQIEIRPWKNINKIYFDSPPAKSDEGKAEIRQIRFIPEYGLQEELP